MTTHETDRAGREARVLADIERLGRSDFGGDVIPRVLDRWKERRAQAQSAARPDRRRLAWFALATAAALAFGVRAGLSPAASAQGSVQRSARGSAEGSAAAASRGGAPSRTSVVSGTAPLWTVGEGPRRAYGPGEALPYGVGLTPSPGVSGALLFANRAEVHLDPGALLIVTPPAAEYDGLSLEEGRCDFRVRPSMHPVRVALGGGAVELWSDAASFGVLAAKSGSWSAAVREGEVRVVMPAEPLRVTAGFRVGGRLGGKPAVGRTPEALAVHARVERNERGVVVHGLSDLLARVEIGAHAVDVDEAGAFSLEAIDLPSRVRVRAIDALGRSAEQAIAWTEPARESGPKGRASGAADAEATAPGALRKRVTPARSAPAGSPATPPARDAAAPREPPAGSENRKVPIEIAPLEW